MLQLYTALSEIYTTISHLVNMVRSKIRLVITNLPLNKVRYISQTQTSGLDPWFVTGFTDGEGSFMISILKNSERRLGWSVNARFEITLHLRDEDILNRIRVYFKNAGNITKFGKDKISYRVNDLVWGPPSPASAGEGTQTSGDPSPDFVGLPPAEKIINIIIPHFQKYPLITKKRGDFELFSSAIELMCNKEHLTKEGLDKLVAIRASMNLGLSELLKASFPLCKPVQQFSDRDLAPLNSKFNPQWVVGFTCGEGYFGVKLLSSSTIKTGKQVKLIFQITQHTRDELLLKSLVDYFGCGKHYVSSREGYGDFQVGKYSDIMKTIIPFFQNNKIVGPWEIKGL